MQNAGSREISLQQNPAFFKKKKKKRCTVMRISRYDST